MKSLPLVFSAIWLCFVAVVFGAGFGDTKADILSQYGEPLSRRYMPEGREVWQYPRGQVTLENNRVSSVVMAENAPFTPSLPAPEPRVIPIEGAAAPAPVVELPPVIRSVPVEELAAGQKLAEELRTSVDFLVAPPDRQRDILRSFRERYPTVDVSDLVRSVDRADQRSRPAINQAADLERRAVAAEREAADAQARVGVERQRLQQEIDRRRAAEREAERQAASRRTVYSPYSYGGYSYGNRSYVQPSVIYTPGYTFQQRTQSNCAPYGYVPYRTIKTKPLTRSSSRLGSLAFRGGSY